ncbi:MAG: hypothetical protein AAF604_14135 [Acidobacteriota bacterium]
MRKLVLSGLLGAVLLAVLEVLSFGLFWWQEGEPFRWSKANAMRARSAGLVPGAPALEERIQAFPDEVLQPFLGFVIDPNLNQKKTRGPLEIGPEGFYRRRQAKALPSDDPLRIGVFGGSVAFVFSFRGGEVLSQRLQSLEGFAESGVAVESWALGGYKQPQQLMTLNWLLARGHELDVVINLDGFNDIALAQTENRFRQVSPFYPRSWDVRVAGVPAGEAAARVGRVAFERQRRQLRAERFSARPWRWSATANLLWLALDRRAAQAVARAEAAAAELAGEESAGFLERGPTYRYRGADLVGDLVSLWERSSRLMHDLCAARGIRYYHFLQPNQYPEGAKPLSREERQKAYSTERRYRAVVQAGYPLLQQAGARLVADGVAFHDLTMLFAQVEETLYIDDCCHLNQRGNELMAAAIGEILEAELDSAP